MQNQKIRKTLNSNENKCKFKDMVGMISKETNTMTLKRKGQRRG